MLINERLQCRGFNIGTDCTFLPLNHGTKGFDVPPKHAARASSKRIHILIRDVYKIGQ